MLSMPPRSCRFTGKGLGTHPPVWLHAPPPARLVSHARPMSLATPTAPQVMCAAAILETSDVAMETELERLRTENAGLRTLLGVSDTAVVPQKDAATPAADGPAEVLPAAAGGEGASEDVGQ